MLLNLLGRRGAMWYLILGNVTQPKNTGVGSLSLLQGIFLTQESI